MDHDIPRALVQHGSLLSLAKHSLNTRSYLLVVQHSIGPAEEE